MLATLGGTAAAISALLTPIGCASTVEEPPDESPPEFARPRGPWTAEELNRDLITCLEQTHQQLMAEFATYRGPPVTLRMALRDRASECMGSKGWVSR
jgi:hypothetical protein